MKVEAVSDFEKFISITDDPEEWFVIEMAKQQIEELSQ